MRLLLSVEENTVKVSLPITVLRILVKMNTHSGLS